VERKAIDEPDTSTTSGGLTVDDTKRSQIEETLGRELAEAELVVVDSLDAMPTSHLDVVETIYCVNPIAAFYYVRGVTRDVDPSTLRRYVKEFDSLIAKRRRLPGMGQQKLYENELGRLLTTEETLPSPSLEEIGEAQRVLTRELARKDRGVALVYLHDLVPSASLQDRQIFLENLPRSE
jgi:hypothetical protein